MCAPHWSRGHHLVRQTLEKLYSCLVSEATSMDLQLSNAPYSNPSVPLSHIGSSRSLESGERLSMAAKHRSPIEGQDHHLATLHFRLLFDLASRRYRSSLQGTWNLMHTASKSEIVCQALRRSESGRKALRLRRRLKILQPYSRTPTFPIVCQ